MAHAAPDRSIVTTAPPLTGRGRPHVSGSIRSRFRQRLRWRLTASYALVTVVVLLSIELLLLACGGVFFAISLNRNDQTIIDDLNREAASQVASLLTPGTPDLAGIDRWLRGIQSNGIVAEGERHVQIRPDASILAKKQTLLLVLDQTGRIAGNIKQTAPPVVLAPVTTVGIPELASIAPAALAGRGTSTPFLQWPPSARINVAVPIRDDHGVVVGALVFSARSPLNATFGVVGKTLGLTALGLVVFGAVIGTISGYVAARQLTVRLDHITEAAAAWGSGDFSAAIADPAEDEIALLGRRLNLMTERLTDLIHAREQLSVVDERNRLARDLHDSVKQQAFAVSMHLATAREVYERKPSDARRHLDAAYDIARQSQQELTTIIQTLRPTELTQASLDRALDRYVAEWRAQTGIAAATKIPPDVVLPDPIEDGLFRIAQEALTNVARHSRATRVNVTLRRDAGAWLLDVVDDGTGFDLRRARRGVGLHSMRERAAALGGTCDVASSPQGTRVTVRFQDASPEGL